MLRLIRRIYRLIIDTTLVRYGTLPTSADTVAAAAVTVTSAAAAWTWGLWAEIAATVGTADVWLVAVTLENYVGLGDQSEIAIATGLAGAEVEKVRIQTTVGGLDFTTSPCYIPAGTRVSARFRTNGALANTVDVKLVVKSGI